MNTMEECEECYLEVASIIISSSDHYLLLSHMYIVVWAVYVNYLGS